MDLNEAKKILKINGYTLVLEGYDPPVDPPEGPDTEEWDNECERQANEETKSAAESMEEVLKKKYPDISISDLIVKEDEDSADYYKDKDEWYYRKEFTCVVQISIPPEAIGMTEESVKGNICPSKVYELTKEAESKMEKLWAEAEAANMSEIAFTDYYDSYYDKNYNVCTMEKSGTFRASQGSSRY